MNYRIPKLTDRQLAEALAKVQRALAPFVEVESYVQMAGQEYRVTGPETAHPFQPGFDYDYDSYALETASLRHSAGFAVLTVQRQSSLPYDSLTLTQDIKRHVDLNRWPQLWMVLQSAAHREYCVAETVAAFRGHEETAWNQYREAQTAVLNSLQVTTERLLTQAAQRNAELDRQREEKYAELEAKLRDSLATERATLEKQIADRNSILGQKEKLLSERESAFETKEARYVARKNQSEQMKRIEEGLKDWHLTEGTRKKRRPIFWGYIVATLCTAGLTGYSVFHSYDLVRTAEDLAKLQWWHWIALSSKTLFPLGAFTTFVVSFIRWSSDWAQQHAREEFRNRALLVDIGRSSWLLEAVRDAQEASKDLPPELLRELAKNLFSGGSDTPTESHSQGSIDVLLKGLSSIRVKSPEGAEVEAKRGK